MVPSSALLDPWADSYSGESRKVPTGEEQEQEEREPNQMLQRRQGVWGPDAESDSRDDSEDWGTRQNSNNRHRRRLHLRRHKRSPVHHHYGGRGVHRGSHSDHYATR